jgi:hypothetical protein
VAQVPLLPQAAFVVPGWQTPELSQQPVHCAHVVTRWRVRRFLRRFRRCLRRLWPSASSGERVSWNPPNTGSVASNASNQRLEPEVAVTREKDAKWWGFTTHSFAIHRVERLRMAGLSS